MKQIQITANDNDTIEFKCSEGKLTASEVVGLLLDGTECVINTLVKELESDDKAKLHDYFTYAFTSILGRMFPENDDFSLTDAAVYKAQNELLEESMEKGIPLEDLIAKYNEKSKTELEDIKANGQRTAS